MTPPCQMSTVRQAISDPADDVNPNVVKVVVDRAATRCTSRGRRFPAAVQTAVCLCKHIGLYAFRREFLLSFAALSQTPLERAESLEQLRALEHGFRFVRLTRRVESVGVDTPEDLERVRRRVSAATRIVRWHDSTT